ncbi:hypothetical protein ACIOZM_20590 [Pseudomonas sp. NPDC087346]|uniref:hypothetical protein n=1 Tax=Pseudomonas sp. NPDC087346 TaxID=3364438 RepID=UPI00382A6B56
MNNLILIANLLARQNQTQLALAAAIEELNHWVEQRGSVEVAENVRSAMFVLDKNLHPFREGIAELMAAGAMEAAAENVKPS